MGPGRRRVAAALLALLLTGCTSPGRPSSPTPPTDTGRLERGPITFAVEGGDAAALARPVAAWNDAHPGEPVTLLELPSGDGQRAPLLAEKAEAGSGEYTVVLLEAAATTEFAANGWLVELPPGEFPTAGMAEAAVASGTYDGTQYAYPLTRDVGVLFYRTDLLERHGLAAPTTWSGLGTTCARVLADDPGPACFTGQLGPHPDLADNVAEAIWSAGGELVASSGEPDVASAGAAAGLGRLAGMVESGLVPRAALGWSGNRARHEFAEGRLLFLRDWWSARARLAGSPDAQVGVAALPGDDAPGVAASGGRNLGISAQARNRATAADFVRHLASATQQLALARAGFGLPSLTGVAGSVDLRDAVPGLAIAEEALTTARALPATARYREFARVVRETCRPVLAGERGAADALADLEDRLADVLG